MEFSRIEAPTVTDLFIQQLQDQILNGNLHPGEQLPTEAELSEQMGISKSAVHLGLKKLQQQGFIEVVPRHGTYIADYLKTGNLDTLLALLKHHSSDLDRELIPSLVDFREALEQISMKNFAKKHTQGDIQYIEKRIRELKTDHLTFEEIGEQLYQFHVFLCLESGNRALPLIFNAFHDTTLFIWQKWVQLNGKDRAIEILEEYTEYLSAGDADKAISVYEREAEKFVSNL